MFLLLTTQKEPPAATKAAASFVDLNGTKTEKNAGPLKCVPADSTTAAIRNRGTSGTSRWQFSEKSTPVTGFSKGGGSGCFRLERLPGGIFTHWKAPPYHGAHPLRTSRPRPKPNDANRSSCTTTDPKQNRLWSRLVAIARPERAITRFPFKARSAPLGPRPRRLSRKFVADQFHHRRHLGTPQIDRCLEFRRRAAEGDHTDRREALG
jgi:hypothetical protein